VNFVKPLNALRRTVANDHAVLVEDKHFSGFGVREIR
jgi:hypothetical protein